MSKLTVIPLTQRNCDQCGSSDFELLWQYHHLTKTRNRRWTFDVRNVICKSCGFIFTSPCLEESCLMEYYSDSFSKFQEQKLDYDVSKRVKVIEEFCLDRSLFLEIGANVKTDFHHKIQSIFTDVKTIEPNEETSDDYSGLEKIDLKATCIGHYFVLEHVPNIQNFLSYCFDMLKPNGIMICEVPSLEKYATFISPLLLFEHVNHFTPNSLKGIASRYGFTEIFTSHERCSRPFGFVSVFRKTATPLLQIDEYDRNKHLYRNGEIAAEALFNKLKLAQTIISKNSSENIIIWAANETTNRLLTNFELPDSVTIIDSDIRKKDYFDPLYKVYQPNDAESAILESDIIIICTDLHAADILMFINTNYSKKYKPENVHVIDQI